MTPDGPIHERADPPERMPEGPPRSDPPERPPGRPRRLGRRIAGVVAAGVVVAAGATIFLAWTERGQRLAIDFALDRLRDTFSGSLSVEEIRDGNILAGVTLAGVRLTAEGERPFLDADSIRLRYSIEGLVRGSPRLGSVTVWGARVRIARYPGEEEFNVARLVRARPDSDPPTGRPTELAVGRVRVEGGALEVLTPASESGGHLVTVPSPRGPDRLSRIALDDVDLIVDDALVRFGGEEPFRGVLERLEARVTLFEEPVRLSGVEGHMRFGERGLVVEDASIRLPGSAFTGRIALGPSGPGEEAWSFRTELLARGPADLADLRWLDPRIPDGFFQGGIDVLAGDGVAVDLRDVSVELEASRVGVDGGVTVDGGRARLRELEVTAGPLVLSRLEPWLERELPLQGFLSGRIRLSGTTQALHTEGRVTLAPEGFGGRPTTADFRGTVHAGSDPGATDLRVLLDPVNFSLLDVWHAGAFPSGGGRVSGDVSGRLASGVRFSADVTHRPDRSGASRVTAGGTVRRVAEGRWDFDVRGELTPVALDLLGGFAPGLGLRGTAAGTARVAGALDGFDVSARLDVAGGRARLDGRFELDGTTPAYRAEAVLEAVGVSEVAASLPDDSEWTGELTIEGRGRTLDSLDARGRLAAGASRLGGLRVDGANAAVRARDGLLTVDTVEARVGGVRMAGGGSVGLGRERVGSARFRFETDSLQGLAPVLVGAGVVARDTLSFLEREVLRADGVDPDTLPLLADVLVEGALRGEVELSGSFDAVDVRGEAWLEAAAYGTNRVDSARLAVTAIGLPARAGRVDAGVTAWGADLLGRDVPRLHGTIEMRDRGGTAELVLGGSRGGGLEARGDFALDSAWGAGEVRVARLRATVDSLVYETAGPAVVSWDSVSIAVEDLEIVQAGPDPMRVTAGGTLSRAGRSDFALRGDGVHVERILEALGVEAPETSAHGDVTLEVRGSAASPEIDAAFNLEEPRYRGVGLDRIAGTLLYRDGSSDVDLEAWARERRVFRATGRVPVDLSLDRSGPRGSSGSFDLRVVADSLDAAVALGTLSFLGDVRGSVSGDFRVRGTPDEPEPSGVFRVRDAAWTIEALGVRHRDVNGTLTLNPDATVDVDLATRSAGRSTVTGRVTIEPLSDPRLDLGIEFRGFQAIERPDLAGRVSGTLALTGTYRRPHVRGSVRVDRGAIFLEEFARSAEVVDLSDPRLFELGVDTAALSARPILAEIRNPFLENLRVDVSLLVPRDTWLRSSDTNVEMGGELTVVYDRQNRDLVLVGELQALRGSYTVLGRSFEVAEGTVGFIGVPGINPTLDIRAVTRIRRPESEPLAVTATVEGTLTQPRVNLSSEDEGIAESDLVSYLIFGRPSSGLATGESTFLQGAAGSGVTWATGALATQLTAAFAQEVGIDYLNVTQASDYAVASGGFTLANTQLEVGQYVGRDVFVVLVLRPPSEQAGGSMLSGARAEVSLGRGFNAEAFVEDRFLRSGAGGFSDLSFQRSRVLGVFIFREWGY